MPSPKQAVANRSGSHGHSVATRIVDPGNAARMPPGQNTCDEYVSRIRREGVPL